MDKVNRNRINDKRWTSLIKKFPTDMKKEYWDLKILFSKYENKRTLFNIHYGNYDVNDHYITIMLHKQNRLNSIILKSLDVL